MKEYGLHAVIGTTFGWNESYLQKRFSEKYSIDWFYWIKLEGNLVGYVCYACRAMDLHVSLLIVDEQFQGKGIGKKVMEAVGDLAKGKKLKVTLSSFKINQNAVSFYEKLGIKIVHQDEHFFDFESGDKE